MSKVLTNRLASGLLLMLASLVVSAVAATADITPQELVRDTSSRMLSALRNDREKIENNPGHLYELVAEIVLP